MRIYHIQRDLDPLEWRKACGYVKALGFDHILLSWPAHRLLDGGAQLVRDCKQAGLSLLADFEPPLSAAMPSDGAWSAELGPLLDAGLAGFRVMHPARIERQEWAQEVGRMRERHPDALFMAWTPGMSPRDVQNLPTPTFDAVFSSLPWWDFRSEWLLEEAVRLRKVGQMIAPVQTVQGAEPPRDPQQAQRLLWTAAFVADGILVQEGMDELAGSDAVEEVNQWIESREGMSVDLRSLSGSLSDLTILARLGEKPAVLLVNANDRLAATTDVRRVSARLPGQYAVASEVAAEVPAQLAPSDVLVFPLADAKPVLSPTGVKAWRRKGVTEAMRSPRVAIERVTPLVDDGAFAVKRTVGEAIEVEADIFMDGHSKLSACVLWRAVDEPNWRRVPMKLVDNHRWSATFYPERVGMHCYAVQAWRDDWLTYQDRLAKRVAAGQDVALDVEEGRMLIARYRDQVPDELPDVSNALSSMLRQIGSPRNIMAPIPQKKSMLTGAATQAGVKDLPTPDDAHVQLLLSELWSSMMRDAPVRPFESTTASYPLVVERREAQYSAWYELFPRSQSKDIGRHGTFLDVIERLPYIREMGFDVLYMPPIHPIGLANRKGKNNSLQAGPGDPGSPYAIGSEQGGHDAVHPELGTLDDFQALVRAAQAQNIEVALDFAIQCSPDHPWLKARPEWFDWRPDGTLRYAENPPKRYEDIVNPEFYPASDQSPSKAGLWKALRDVILFWADQGVRIFRVDNPHTKPLPFWQWMIAEVQGAYPDVLFLSEAFTHPKLMYRLGKLGFSQSYTYFTWRNNKQELTEYLREVSTSPVADHFRPHFFVNTPDINPTFLQTSGRAGFLIRAALAATSSGLWGMYSGFELCEATPVPGKEEYLDSEKYELRQWDWDRPGNIIAEVARLNQIRKTNPALQIQRGLEFHRVDNERILYFTRSTPERDNIVVVAISLDPKLPQAGTLELPVADWGMQGRAVRMQDLLTDQHFTAYDARRYIELTPEHPILIWRLSSGTGA